MSPGYKRECTNHFLPLAQRSNARSTIRIVVPVSLQVQQRVHDVQGLVTLAFSLLNQAATNSGVDVTFQNAGILNTGYNDNLSSTIFALLSRLGDRNDPALGGPVNRFREANRAHLTAMLTTKDQVACGVAHMPASANAPNSLTVDYCITALLMFNHEIGHNFGVYHEWTPSSGHLPLYAHGYQQTRVVPFWRTVVTGYCTNNRDCPLINSFSNPNRTHNGLPTGNVNNANGVRRMNELRHVIETFVPGGPVVPPPVISPPFRLETHLTQEL